MYELGEYFGEATMDPGSNLLIAGPPLTGKRRLALRALETGAENGEGSIVVTTRDSAERVTEDVRALFANPDDAHMGIVDCVTKHQGQSVEDSETVKYASSPVDMTGIGIKFAEFVEEFYRDQGIRQNRVVLDSLSTLLLYSNLQTVFQFMHVFTSRIDNADALGIHVIESTAHDEETMNTLQQLFDGIIHTDENRGVSLQLPGVDSSTVGS